MKYMGSKSRLSKDIVPILNKIIVDNNIDTYIEPFVGGANIIDKIQCKNKIGCDNNEYLICMWNDLQHGWTPPSEINKELYDDIKNNKDKYNKSIVAVTGLCATYNAKWFGGYAGKVKTKINTIRDYYDESIRNIEKQVPNILNVQFICGDYKNLKPCNALIYCDPPYQNTTKYKDSFNHEEYWNKVREWSKNNIVICSEYSAPEDFVCIFEKQLITTLDKDSRKINTEKLFMLK